MKLGERPEPTKRTTNLCVRCGLPLDNHCFRHHALVDENGVFHAEAVVCPPAKGWLACYEDVPSFRKVAT